MHNAILGDDIALGDAGILDLWPAIAAQTQTKVIDRFHQTYKWPVRLNDASAAKNICQK